MALGNQHRLVPYGTAKVLKVTGTSSYPTGGYDLASSNVVNVSNAPNALVGLNDGGAQIALVAGAKVKFIVAATGLEVAAAADMSGVTVSVLVP